jgi:hypothetical protein
MTDKPLRISGPNPHSEEVITERLLKAAGRARQHVVTTVKELNEVIAYAEREIEALCIPKKHWRGITATVSTGYPGKKYSGKVSCLTLTRNTSCWLLKDIKNADAYPKTSMDCRLDLTQSAWEASLSNIMNGYKRVSVDGKPLAFFDPFEAVRYLHQVPGLIKGSSHERIKAISELERLAGLLSK